MDDPNEVFDLVDEDDNVIGRATRARCNSDPALIHRVSFVLITNEGGRVLWQKRSASKDTAPGEWTLSACGHVNSGESYEETAVREVQEELGVDVSIRFVGKYLMRYPNENEWTAIFEARSEGPFDVDRSEVSEVAFMSVDEVVEGESRGELVIAQSAHMVLAVLRSD